MISIYAIVNINNGKTYVGQTTRNPQKRFNEHLRLAKKAEEQGWCYRKKGLYYDIWRQGKESFIFKILEEVESNADVEEDKWIEELDSIESGYNDHKDNKARKRYYAKPMKRKSVEVNMTFSDLFGGVSN